MKLNDVFLILVFANIMFETLELRLTLGFSSSLVIFYMFNLSLYVFKGSAMPMPPELMELYTLYQQELETSSKNEKETKLISDLNIMMRVKNSIDIN